VGFEAPPSPFDASGRGGLGVNFMPPVPNIINGQPVDASKIRRSREFRLEPTPSERLLWSRLRAHRLNGFKFRRQQIIDGFIVDFYCHAASLIVEIDGPIHDKQQQADFERDRILAAKGLHIVRFTNNDVDSNLPATLNAIAILCQQRTA